MSTIKKCLSEGLLMSTGTHKISFHGEMRKRCGYRPLPTPSYLELCVMGHVLFPSHGLA